MMIAFQRELTQDGKKTLEAEQHRAARLILTRYHHTFTVTEMFDQLK